MKVVINKCFGGYSLSDKAINLLYQRLNLSYDDVKWKYGRASNLSIRSNKELIEVIVNPETLTPVYCGSADSIELIESEKRYKLWEVITAIQNDHKKKFVGRLSYFKDEEITLYWDERSNTDETIWMHRKSKSGEAFCRLFYTTIYAEDQQSEWIEVKE
jgi:hypothetical protein